MDDNYFDETFHADGPVALTFEAEDRERPGKTYLVGWDHLSVKRAAHAVYHRRGVRLVNCSPELVAEVEAEVERYRARLERIKARNDARKVPNRDERVVRATIAACAALLRSRFSGEDDPDEWIQGWMEAADALGEHEGVLLHDVTEALLTPKEHSPKIS